MTRHFLPERTWCIDAFVGIRCLKVSEADAPTQPMSSPQSTRVSVCAAVFVLPLRLVAGPTGLLPCVCLKASSTKVIIKKSAIELLSQISACREAKMLRERERADEPERKRGINVGV